MPPVRFTGTSYRYNWYRRYKLPVHRVPLVQPTATSGTVGTSSWHIGCLGYGLPVHRVGYRRFQQSAHVRYRGTVYPYTGFRRYKQPTHYWYTRYRQPAHLVPPAQITGTSGTAGTNYRHIEYRRYKLPVQGTAGTSSRYIRVPESQAAGAPPKDKHEERQRSAKTKSW